MKLSQEAYFTIMDALDNYEVDLTENMIDGKDPETEIECINQARGELNAIGTY